MLPIDPGLVLVVLALAYITAHWPPWEHEHSADDIANVVSCEGCAALADRQEGEG